jgi:hypothetical protein
LRNSKEHSYYSFRIFFEPSINSSSSDAYSLESGSTLDFFDLMRADLNESSSFFGISLVLVVNAEIAVLADALSVKSTFFVIT